MLPKFITFLSLALLLTGMATAQESETDLFARGLLAYKRQDYTKSIAFMDKAYWTKGPLSQRALFYIIAGQLLTGQKERAIENLDLLNIQELEPQEKEVAEKLRIKYLGMNEQTPSLPWFFDVNPYYGNISFDANTTKERSSYKGISAGVARGAFRLDAGFEKMELDFSRKTTVDNFIQTQWTFLGSFFPSPNWGLKAGYATVSNDFHPLDGVKVISLGIDYFQPVGLQGGLGFSQSTYPNYRPEKLTVMQFSPYLGHNFGNPGKESGGLYNITIMYHQIQPTVVGKESAIANPLINRDFNSLDLQFHYWRGKIHLEASKWFGKQNFAVLNHGFVIYNLSEEHVGGMKGGVDLSVTPSLVFGISLALDEFIDNTTKEKSTTKNLMGKIVWKSY